MPKHIIWIYAALWIVVAAGLGLAAADSWISMATFWWLNAAAVVFSTTLVMALRSGRQTRSVAQVLYDTEHGTDSSR